MIPFKTFINTKYLSKFSKNYLYINDYYLIKNNKLHINDYYQLLENYKYYLVFSNDKGTLEINYLDIHNYQIMYNDKNITKILNNYVFNSYILEAVDIIYKYHLKNIHNINLNDIFDIYISRYKIIYNILKDIFFKSDLKLQIKNNKYILQWNKLL